MSILATTLISDVKQDFEGGRSLSVDWDILIRRAVENTMEKVTPETLKRSVAIYGGLSQNLYEYYAPSDIYKPASFYLTEGLPVYGAEEREYMYMPPKQYYRQIKNKTYTLETKNGIKSLIIQHSTSNSVLEIDDMDSVGTISGDVTVSLNEHNYIQGSAAIEATFTDSGDEIGDTFDSTKDISDYISHGIGVVPAYFSTASNISSIELRLKTDDSNYYYVNSTTDTLGGYFKNGWNMIKFKLSNLSETGSPSSTSIDKWSIVITTSSGETETIIIDRITLQTSEVGFLDYISDAPFINGSTNEKWQSTISYANGDSINFDKWAGGILHYELCILVEHSASYKPKMNFKEQLQIKYPAYYGAYPSSEAPPTYSKSPEIGFDRDVWGQTNLQDDTIEQD